MKKTLFSLVIILFYTSVSGQELLKFSAQIRPRFEIDNKDFNSSTRAGTFTALRTRLGISFYPSKNLTGFIQAQDSRIFGEETSTTANMKNLDLHQAYFKIENVFDLPVDLKVGRFEAAYGSERFISVVGWHNIGRSFDGGILTYKNSFMKIDLMAAREFEKSLPGDSTDQNVYSLFADLKLIDSYRIEPFIIWQRMQPSTVLNRATLGFNIKGNLNRFTHEIDFGYQTGSLYSGGRTQDISAYTFSFGAEYKAGGELKTVLGAQVDIASGDDNQADSDYKSYTSLYASGHKFFGYMDYFMNFPSDTYGLGIIDLIGKISISPVHNITLNLNAHLFSSMQEYRLNSGVKSNSFGSEFDLVGNYKYNENVMFESGASLFFPGDIFKEKRGHDSALWFYIMAVVNF